MSDEIRLEYGGISAEVMAHQEGGTYAVGNTKAELNVTWNYNVFFREHLDEKGLDYLCGKKAKDTIEKLEIALENLNGFKPNDNYWKPTAGNARKVLEILLEWAQLHPSAIWKVF